MRKIDDAHGGPNIVGKRDVGAVGIRPRSLRVNRGGRLRDPKVDKAHSFWSSGERGVEGVLGNEELV